MHPRKNSRLTDNTAPQLLSREIWLKNTFPWTAELTRKMYTPTFDTEILDKRCALRNS